MSAITPEERARWGRVYQPGEYVGYAGPHNEWLPRLLAALDAADALVEVIKWESHGHPTSNGNYPCARCSCLAAYRAHVAPRPAGETGGA